MLRPKIQTEMDATCYALSRIWGFPVYIGLENLGAVDKDKALNLNAPAKVLETLKNLGYKVPKVRIKNEDTDEYEQKESTNELALQKLLADSTLWPANSTGEGIKLLLKAKELTTFRNRYLNARLHNGTYLSNYNVAATVTGRRGSKKNLFGFGGNAQNFPARGTLAEAWRECIIARTGRIFFYCDQVQAEDWPVQALANNTTAIAEMQAGVNRHYRFAAAIFNRTVDDIKRMRELKDDVAEMQYYLGKKGRHSNNYGMQPQRMSESLAAEGYTVDKQTCTTILETINRIDPNVRSVFHNYVREQLFTKRKLVTPFGRERAFFGLRSNDKNYKILNEAYAQIPQSTVGDNNGLAVLYLCNCNDYVLQDGHDSICQEVPDEEAKLVKVFEDTQEAYNRSITFYNGITVKIPIDGKIGYDWKNLHEIKPFTVERMLDVIVK